MFPIQPHTLSPQSALPHPLPSLFIQGLASFVLCSCPKIGLGRETFSCETQKVSVERCVLSFSTVFTQAYPHKGCIIFHSWPAFREKVGRYVRPLVAKLASRINSMVEFYPRECCCDNLYKEKYNCTKLSLESKSQGSAMPNLDFLRFCFCVFPFAVALCPTSWTQFESNCYLFGTPPATWSAARSTCEKRDGNLMYIESARENTFAQTFAQGFSPLSNVFFIGYNDIDREGVWVWSGVNVTSRYTNWQSGEPNNVKNSGYPPGEDCVLMTATAPGKWNDVPCGMSRNYICKRAGNWIWRIPSFHLQTLGNRRSLLKWGCSVTFFLASWSKREKKLTPSFCRKFYLQHNQTGRKFKIGPFRNWRQEFLTLIDRPEVVATCQLALWDSIVRFRMISTRVDFFYFCTLN